MEMWTKKWNCWRLFLCSLLVVGLLAAFTNEVNADDQDIPSESQCRPYIEKALKDLETGDTHSVSEDIDSKQQDDSGSEEDNKAETVDEDSSVEILNEESAEEPSVELADEPYINKVEVNDVEGAADDSKESGEEKQDADDSKEESDEKGNTDESGENQAADQSGEDDSVEGGEKGDSNEASAEEKNTEEDDADGNASVETQEDDKPEEKDASGEDKDSNEGEVDNSHERVKRDAEDTEEAASKEDDDSGSKEGDDDSKEGGDDSKEDGDSDSKESDSKEGDDSKEEGVEAADGDSKEQSDDDSKQDDDSKEGSDSKEGDSKETVEDDGKDDSKEEAGVADDSKEDTKTDDDSGEDTGDKDDSKDVDDSKSEEDSKPGDESEEKEQGDAPGSDEEQEDDSEEKEAHPEEDLLMEIEIPDNLRSRDHITQILRLDDESTEGEILVEKSADITLRELKRLYDNAIKPLEILFKYRDLSNRHYGDPEIFSKPLVLFMGPWSGGKSSLINYLTDNEFTEWSLRTGAEPSPAYFNILMHGAEPQVLDGTQLAADWTFSGLQKFGQGLEERLRGLKLPSKLLEKVNIVEIPGILEVRKQVSRVFPFNDACQWFIDRADIIFLVYDPSKLDVGPETEAILDQLKGRESQTRIILNKADQVKPEELMRVQSALIWNISPLMSSAQPPAMYTTSLWSLPYESGAPARLLLAQERTFLKDLREAIDKRVDNKIASARRFAVRVRNHAKMVDCYLTTYYNHKTIFANKKVVAEAIIEHPQNYHIYEGLSTLTNISRYDLPDPETYRDFFRLNPLYEFQQLSATCTYFRGCPINRLDIAIAYDLPELVGKYKKMVESATPQGMPKS